MVMAVVDKRTELHKRGDVLRAFENDCYRICYALIRYDRAALQAAKEAIRELLLDESFYRLPDDRRPEAVRRTAIKHALRHHAERTPVN